MPPEDVALQAEDTQAEQTPAEAPAEKLLGKYDTVDELGNAYKHLESRLGQQGNELATERAAREAAEQQLEALMAEQRAPQQPQYGGGQDPLVAAFEHAYEQGDATMMLAVQAELANRAADARFTAQPAPEPREAEPQDFETAAAMAEQLVWQRHGDEYGELRDKVSEKLNEFPGLVHEQNLAGFQRGIDAAFRLAREEKLLDTQQRLAQQQQAAEDSRAAKLAAQTATGAGPRPISKSEMEKVWEEIETAPSGSGFSTR